MRKEVLKEPKFTEDIVSIIRSGLGREQLIEKLESFKGFPQEGYRSKLCFPDKGGTKGII